MKYINLKDSKEEKISFVGKGTIDDKDIEIHFQVLAGDINVERDDWNNPKITMFPTWDENLKCIEIIEV